MKLIFNMMLNLILVEKATNIMLCTVFVFFVLCLVFFHVPRQVTSLSTFPKPKSFCGSQGGEHGHAA